MIKVNAESLKAAVPFISHDDSRPMIEGVLFQDGLLVSTDGHRLAAIKPNTYEGQAADFILPHDVIVKVLKVKKEYKYRPLLIVIEEKTVSVIQEDKDGIVQTIASFPYAPIDGTFPEWRRVFPNAEDCSGQGAIARFNAAYLGSFASFGHGVALYLNKDATRPSIVRGSVQDEFEAVGVIMPMRLGSEQSQPLPDWLTEKQGVSKAA